MPKSNGNGRKRGSLRTYKSYNFIDKDPVIDGLRGVVSESHRSYQQIYKSGGPTPATMRKWFMGNTRRPQFCTISACALALGKRNIRYGRGGHPIFTD